MTKAWLVNGSYVYVERNAENINPRQYTNYISILVYYTNTICILFVEITLHLV